MRTEKEIREYIKTVEIARKKHINRGMEAYTTVHDATIQTLEWVLEESEEE